MKFKFQGTSVHIRLEKKLKVKDEIFALCYLRRTFLLKFVRNAEERIGERLFADLEEKPNVFV